MSLAKNEIKKFEKKTTKAREYHRELLTAVHLKTHQAALETMLAEQFVFNIGVYWEVFINDLLLSYLVMSPVLFSKNLKERMRQSLKAKFGEYASKKVTFNDHRRITSAQAKALVDPEEFNISVNSSDKLVKKADELLAVRYARLFYLAPEDRQFIDYLISLRNYLAHRSSAARIQLKDSIKILSGTNANLKGSISNIGTYLKTKNKSGDPRSIVISNRLIEIALKLA